MAFNASSSGRPSFMASAAHNGRYSCGTTGESVVMAIRIPSLHRTPGVVKDLFASSNFDLWVRDGPTIAGYPLAFTCALKMCIRDRIGIALHMLLDYAMQDPSRNTKKQLIEELNRKCQNLHNA